ncbi:hypothetical protein HZB60_01145 [candidate division KSB1 bacterium]|nr:hypothetical protein [candidate division KSB1 bacterium]
MYTPQFAIFWAQYRRAIVALALVICIVALGLVLRVEGKMIAAVAALVGIVTSAFSGVAALIALIPWAGPLIVKALSLPVVWLLNGAGYFTSIFLARRGHAKSVVDSRILTITLLVGIIIGYIIGKII